MRSDSTYVVRWWQHRVPSVGRTAPRGHREWKPARSRFALRERGQPVFLRLQGIGVRILGTDALVRFGREHTATHFGFGTIRFFVQQAKTPPAAECGRARFDFETTDHTLSGFGTDCWAETRRNPARRS